MAVDRAHAAFFQAYCVECHGKESPEAGVRLDDLPFVIADIPAAERWQKVLNVLNAGEMPPGDASQPTAAELGGLLGHVSGRMVAARKALSDSGSLAAMRRLNKREYENTIRDLLGVAVDTKDLPADGGGGAFDTQGKSLFFSSDQFELYLAVAREALDRAIVTGPRPETKTVRTEAEDEPNRRITAVLRGYLMSGYRAYRQWSAADGQRPPTDFGFPDEKELLFRRRAWEEKSPTMIDYLSRSESRSGALLTLGEPNGQAGIGIPNEMPPGHYRIRAAIGLLPDADPERSFVEIGFRGRSLNDAMNLVACRQVTATQRRPEVIEIDVDLPRLTRPLSEETGPETKKSILVGGRVIALRERQSNNGGGVARHKEALRETGFGVEPALWVDWIEWEGPIHDHWPPDSHARIFFRGADAVADETYAREIIDRFATRAFRGAALQPGYLDRLVGHFRERLAAGDSFEEAIKEPLSIVLASPSFLYLLEPVAEQAAAPVSTPRAPIRLTNIELANRLAYFLWSAPPDDELLATAESGNIARPSMLAAQVDRLLASPKSRAFVGGFVHQWLGMERLDFFQFSTRLYPRFDDSVKEAARQEVYETIRTVLAEDQPLGTLLKSDFVVINDLLATYYGIDGVAGSEFRKVPVPAGLPRGGLLGMAAVHAMGSDGERSSPVERGAWVLRKLLNDPPPPAPANVPQLSRHAGQLLSARELLSAHMEKAQCAQCHRTIDPIGFGLEHFDASGLWREQELTEILARNNTSVRRSREHPIDSSGTLPDGTPFNGFAELRDAVARQEAAFAHGLAENLAAYALGRPCSFVDEDLVKQMTAPSRDGPRTLRAMIQTLVASPAFHSK